MKVVGAVTHPALHLTSRLHGVSPPSSPRSASSPSSAATVVTVRAIVAASNPDRGTQASPRQPPSMALVVATCHLFIFLFFLFIFIFLVFKVKSFYFHIYFIYPISLYSQITLLNPLKFQGLKFIYLFIYLYMYSLLLLLF